MSQPSNTQVSVRDRKLLAQFFWFAFALSLLLLFLSPSGTTVGIALSVAALGAPLFKKRERTPSQAAETTSRDQSDTMSISRNWWIFLGAITFGMPFLFGRTPAAGLLVYFTLAFFGLAIGTVILAVVKFSSVPSAANQGKSSKAVDDHNRNP